MNISLPDVSLTECPAVLAPLDWVGMQGIDVPLWLAEFEAVQQVHAQADIQVDLPQPHTKGIHMSRLYRLLDEAAQQPLTPTLLAQLLADAIHSHADCHSRRARLQLRFALLARRAALLTPGLAGWKSYPVQVRAQWQDGHLALHTSVEIVYSSTCPCSAALTRQLVEQAFTIHFAGQEQLSRSDAAAWLRQQATLATPHSQRSVARVRVSLPATAATLGLLPLIDTVEAALATPVQTAVKRADEQAFARLNGQNLMFVEDAARRVQQALHDYQDASVQVQHLESLHPHDAVAWAGPDHTQATAPASHP